eukprot:395200_1
MGTCFSEKAVTFDHEDGKSSSQLEKPRNTRTTGGWGSAGRTRVSSGSQWVNGPRPAKKTSPPATHGNHLAPNNTHSNPQHAPPNNPSKVPQHNRNNKMKPNKKRGYQQVDDHSPPNSPEYLNGIIDHKETQYPKRQQPMAGNSHHRPQNRQPNHQRPNNTSRRPPSFDGNPNNYPRKKKQVPVAKPTPNYNVGWFTPDTSRSKKSDENDRKNHQRHNRNNHNNQLNPNRNNNCNPTAHSAPQPETGSTLKQPESRDRKFGSFVLPSNVFNPAAGGSGNDNTNSKWKDWKKEQRNDQSGNMPWNSTNTSNEKKQSNNNNNRQQHKIKKKPWNANNNQNQRNPNRNNNNQRHNRSNQNRSNQNHNPQSNHNNQGSHNNNQRHNRSNQNNQNRSNQNRNNQRHANNRNPNQNMNAHAPKSNDNQWETVQTAPVSQNNAPVQVTQPHKPKPSPQTHNPNRNKQQHNADANPWQSVQTKPMAHNLNTRDGMPDRSLRKSKSSPPRNYPSKPKPGGNTPTRQQKQQRRQQKANNYPSKPVAGGDVPMRPPTRQQRQQRRQQKEKKKTAAELVWEINENDVSSDDTVEMRKKSVMQDFSKRKSMINYSANANAAPTNRVHKSTNWDEERRKSVFEESSSDSSSEDGGAIRLSVDISHAKNHSVSGVVNLNPM